MEGPTKIGLETKERNESFSLLFIWCDQGWPESCWSAAVGAVVAVEVVIIVSK